MDMKALDIFWYLGIGMCIVYIFIYIKEIIQLASKKKTYTLTKGKIRTCTMDKKWAYTETTVKYDYAVDGEQTKGIGSVKSVLKTYVYNGKEVDVYYDPNHPTDSFLDDQMKSDRMNILVLLILGVILVVTLIV